MRGVCSAEAKAACPFRKCIGSDTHHLAFPANQYRTRVENEWRELRFNKTQVPRCLHNAIHASDYLPEKPPRAEMVGELQMDEAPYRALDERMVQLALGHALMQGDPDYFGGDAA